MPAYDYMCDNEHVTERIFAVAEKPFAIKCPKCRKEALQVILTAPAIHTCATFSRDITDPEVVASRNPGDGSYLDPTLSYDWDTGKVVAPITSEKQRQQLMESKGLFEKPMSDKAKDVQRLKRTKPVHFLPKQTKTRQAAVEEIFMPEIEQGQTPQSEAPEPFVTLSAGDEAYAAENEITAPAPEASESESSEALEGSPLDDIEYDENDPAQKAAYDALRKKMLPKWQARVEALKKKSASEPPPATPAEQPQAQQAEQGEAWDPYTVPLDTFKYSGDPEPEGSDLAGFEQSIDRRIEQGVKKAIEFTLQQMRVNDGKLREAQQVGTALEQISKYAEVLMAHPDYEEKAAELAEYAQMTKDMAVKNPEKWIRSVEAITGIKRNWQEETDSDQVQRGQQNQRTANKLRNVVPRSTRPTTPRDSAEGSMDFESAFEHAMKAAGR